MTIVVVFSGIAAVFSMACFCVLSFYIYRQKKMEKKKRDVVKQINKRRRNAALSRMGGG